MSKRSITFFNLWVLLFSTFFSNSHPAPSLDQILQENTLVENKKIEYNYSGLDEKISNVIDFDSLNITLHPGSEFTPDDKSTPSSLNHCKSLVYKTLKSLPPEATAQLKNLTLYFSDEGRRGLGGGSTIILRCQNVTDKELVGVLVHEMGHIIDTGLLQGSSSSKESKFKDGGSPVYNDDPSVLFYRLNFENENKLKLESSQLDFVSGYAMSDPFEDFAETHNFYVLHGDEFRTLMQNNKILQAKYNFMKTWVYHGKEFFNGDISKLSLEKRAYDTTVLNYDEKKFFVL